MAKSESDARESHLAHLIGLGLSPAAAQATMDIDHVMIHIRRSMQRREMGRMALRDLGPNIDIADLEILGALELCAIEGGEATVGLIAERLNVDPSRASRIVADAVDKGIVRRVASQSDARRTGLELTELGQRHGAVIRAYKWRIFAEALGDWPEEDLVTFARLFQRFSGWMTEAKAKAGKG
ncbi:Transcriptional regulator, MarR family [Devosia sp. LC5]|uniref:MarR family winged helix-turn-helix transcriptional regulator n=1 Tax=Devosia sp. LC5 TaxID=1502724 RepID=UPI0004E442A1|nr:MarR family winged helix-turn-helix transcriptional regulator [Devosia sp. LC5]KFC71062.1 Transcriptional regulator, MarR family [Devosia sp. LC5]